MKKYILTKNAPIPIGPYSQAIFIDNFLYISGQIAINPKTKKLINSTIENETKQIMENINAILEQLEMNYNNIIKTSFFIKKINHFDRINNIYSQSFKDGKYPVRETIEVSNLPKNANIEISVIAYKEIIC